MRDRVGVSAGSLRTTFLPGFLPMTVLMAGRIPLAALFAQYFDVSRDPLHPEFWFRMSMALLAGFIVAYPMNWWLVARHLKHGMLTVRPAPRTKPAAELTPRAETGSPASGHSDSAESPNTASSAMAASAVRPIALLGMVILSLAALAAGLVFGMWIFTPH